MDLDRYVAVLPVFLSCFVLFFSDAELQSPDHVTEIIEVLHQVKCLNLRYFIYIQANNYSPLQCKELGHKATRIGNYTNSNIPPLIRPVLGMDASHSYD